ncbi:DUF1837 domain-containing protein [Bacillus sp. V3B]|uniref:Hachiman antiphage defense system protein HamA n=1 Tax=Bacillus sp. V3B TaxID=2804915 RepID=UPI00210C5BFA|nr:Hachiman antiphage defense system protein HamA [Bacillus sp. V3B]MCQ6275874.1 DUF1837 domain-containing protein [Bacillus sp. V3B]
MTTTIPEHIRWFANTGKSITTPEGENIEVLEFKHESDEEVLSFWAEHFRQHYCLDDEIDYFRKGYGYTKTEFLNKIKFPDPSRAPGPSTRAGDFSEILVADYLEFILDYWVPRTRYGAKTVSNESTKGCDTLAFKIIKDGEDKLEDTLAIFEAKAQFSGKKPKARLQDAINDSVKDQARKAESLNAIKQQLFFKNKMQEATRIDRFQNPIDRPYNEVSGAVALFSSNLFDPTIISNTSANDHPNQNNLKLVVIHGKDMMDLVHELYRRAADEA